MFFKECFSFFVLLGEHGGTEFPVIIEPNCLTVVGMDTGYTKVALPFSVSKVWPFQNGLIIERQS